MGMLRTAPEPSRPSEAVNPGDDRRPLWWYARVVRRHCESGGRLIEYGCRDGRLLEHLVGEFEVFGYDEDPVRRQRCRAAVPDAVILEEWDAAESEGFDVVVALDCARAPRVKELIGGLADKVAPGGMLFIVAPNPGGLAHWLKGREWSAGDTAGTVALLSRGEWMTVMRKANLKVVDIESDGFWDAPYLPLVPAALQRAVCDVPVEVQSYWPISRSLWPPAVGEGLLITARKGS